MEIINPNFDLQAFYSQLRQSQRRVLMLDYDGTLAPFTTERDRAYPYPRLRPVLEQLVESVRTRTVIISGRSVDMLKTLLRLKSLPELWGCHGLERLSREGQYTIPRLAEKTREGLRAIEEWSKDNYLQDVTEKKPCGFAFHWRGLPTAEVTRMKSMVAEKWSETVAPYGLALHSFDGGIEIRVAGVDKGHAVETILTNLKIPAVFAYLGDDLTDEDAFRKVGSHGAKVLVRPSLRATAADIWLTPPDELAEFLKNWL